MSHRTTNGRPLLRLAQGGGLILAASLVVAACGGTAGTSPSASILPSVEPSTSTSASTGELLPSASPSSSVSGVTGTPTPSDSMTADQLVTAIPTQVGTTALTVRTAEPKDLPLFDSTSGSEVTTLLSELGVDASKVAAAVGSATDGSLVIGALSVQGVDTIKLQMAFRAMLSASGSSGSSSTIAGRSVNTVALPDGSAVYAYTWGPTLWLVRSSDETVATQALGLLPGPKVAS